MVVLAQSVDYFPLEGFNHVKILVYLSLICVLSGVLWLLICGYLPCYSNNNFEKNESHQLGCVWNAFMYFLMHALHVPNACMFLFACIFVGNIIVSYVYVRSRLKLKDLQCFSLCSGLWDVVLHFCCKGKSIINTSEKYEFKVWKIYNI